MVAFVGLRIVSALKNSRNEKMSVIFAKVFTDGDAMLQNRRDKVTGPITNASFFRPPARPPSLNADRALRCDIVEERLTNTPFSSN